MDVYIHIFECADINRANKKIINQKNKLHKVRVTGIDPMLSEP